MMIPMLSREVHEPGKKTAVWLLDCGEARCFELDEDTYLTIKVRREGGKFIYTWMTERFDWTVPKESEGR